MRTTVVTLPNGFVDDTGSEIREIEIRKLTGEEEDLILDKEELRKGGILDRLLVRCIVRMGTHSDEHTIRRLYYSHFILADCQYLLVELRKWGIDPLYRFEHTCPRCEKIGKHRIDLNTLHLDQQKDEYRFQKEFTDTVDNDGEQTPFTFRLLTINDNKMLEAIRLEHKTEKGTRELLLQLKDFGGKKPDVKVLRKLTWGVRNRVRDAINARTGGLDNELLFICRHCDRHYKDNMPIEVKSFFFPAEDSLETKTAIPFRDSGTTSPFSDLDTDGNQTKSGDSTSKSDSSTSEKSKKPS